MGDDPRCLHSMPGSIQDVFGIRLLCPPLRQRLPAAACVVSSVAVVSLSLLFLFFFPPRRQTSVLLFVMLLTLGRY